MPQPRPRPRATPAPAPRSLRPLPPVSLVEPGPDRTEPAPDFLDWLRREWLNPGGAFYSTDHEHLTDAVLGVCWTNVEHRSRQLYVLAEARVPTVQAGPWVRARHDQQLEAWFGQVPDFLLTFYAPALAGFNARDFCAVVDHELRHCAHATTAAGALRFHRETGTPIYAIKGHDIEQFQGTVERFGSTEREREFARAVLAAPSVQDGDLLAGCGTCGSRLALSK